MSPLRVPRTLIISDMHLGRPGGARSAAAFSALVSQFDRVIVNGDAAELHHVRYQRDAEHELERFRDGCVSRGIRLDFIAGNHDPFVTDVRSISLADGAIYVTHGDAMHPAIAPWSPFSRSMRECFEATMKATPVDTPLDVARFNAARAASLAEWRVMGAGAHVSTMTNIALRPHRIAAVLAYWTRYPRLAAEWGASFAPRAGTIIVGHSHRAFEKTVNGRRVANTGAYGFPGTPHAIVVEGSEVRMHRVIDRSPYYALQSAPSAKWPIAFHEATAGARHSNPRAAESAPVMNRAAASSAMRSMDVE